MKDIVGYEGIYAITSCGRVWSYRRNKFLSSYSTKNGYQLVSLCTEGKEHQCYVHRLVGQAYIENPDNLPQINHKDEVTNHNWVNNLEWCTQQYNNNYGSHNVKMGQAVSRARTGKTYKKKDNTAAAPSSTVERGVTK